jgi:hypothetical protein
LSRTVTTNSPDMAKKSIGNVCPTCSGPGVKLNVEAALPNPAVGGKLACAGTPVAVSATSAGGTTVAETLSVIVCPGATLIHRDRRIELNADDARGSGDGVLQAQLPKPRYARGRSEGDAHGDKACPEPTRAGNRTRRRRQSITQRRRSVALHTRHLAS